MAVVMGFPFDECSSFMRGPDLAAAKCLKEIVARMLEKDS